MKTWLITGASSGFGEALAHAALERGDTVIATYRKADQCARFDEIAPGRSFGIRMDVTDSAAVDEGIRTAIEKCGRIDVLVNNAGYALRGPIEQLSDSEALHQLDTNVLGILRVTRAVLPIMRSQGGGRIINISSTAGTIGFATLGLYAASKAAVIGLTESLSHEVSRMGIHVTSVEPGGFRTNFGSSSMITPAAPVPEPYVKLMEAMDANMAKFAETARGDPALAAARLLELADTDAPPVRLAMGDDALPMISSALERRLDEYRAHARLGQGTSSF